MVIQWLRFGNGVATGGTWIVAVGLPFCRVVHDIFPDAVQFIVVADDMFPIIALPQWLPRRIADLVDPFGGGGFEPGHQRTQ